MGEGESALRLTEQRLLRDVEDQAAATGQLTGEGTGRWGRGVEGEGGGREGNGWRSRLLVLLWV